MDISVVKQNLDNLFAAELEAFKVIGTAASNPTTLPAILAVIVDISGLVAKEGADPAAIVDALKQLKTIAENFEAAKTAVKSQATAA